MLISNGRSAVAGPIFAIGGVAKCGAWLAIPAVVFPIEASKPRMLLRMLLLPTIVPGIAIIAGPLASLDSIGLQVVANVETTEVQVGSDDSVVVVGVDTD